MADIEKNAGLATANRDQLQLLARVNRVITSAYDEEVAATFLRTSCPFICDRSPLEVIANERPEVAQELAARAVLGFLEP